MLADDEGIVIDSMKFIIEKEFGSKCTVEYAKTGRQVIELADKHDLIKTGGSDNHSDNFDFEKYTF